MRFMSNCLNELGKYERNMAVLENNWHVVKHDLFSLHFHW